MIIKNYGEASHAICQSINPENMLNSRNPFFISTQWKPDIMVNTAQKRRCAKVNMFFLTSKCGSHDNFIDDIFYYTVASKFIDNVIPFPFGGISTGSSKQRKDLFAALAIRTAIRCKFSL